jgi:hypothetical protein
VLCEAGKPQKLKVKISFDGRHTRGGLLVPTAFDRAGYDVLEAYAKDPAVPRLHNFLGQRVQRVFIDPDGDGTQMKEFRGLVIGYDPTDQDQTFQLWYEDGDTEWVPTSHLRKLMVNPYDDAPELKAMAALQL